MSLGILGQGSSNGRRMERNGTKGTTSWVTGDFAVSAQSAGEPFGTRERPAVALTLNFDPVNSALNAICLLYKYRLFQNTSRVI